MLINEERKKLSYRFLEGFLGYTSFSFFIILLTLSIIKPAYAAVFLIVYSFMWVLRITLVHSYMIFSYKNHQRWSTFNISDFINIASRDYTLARQDLLDLKKKYKSSMGWKRRLDSDIRQLEKNQGTKFAKINKMYQIPIFAVYNEPASVLIRSLESLYKADYDLSKVVVFISQEARMGEEFNKKIRDIISKESWVSANNVSESDLDLVYNGEHHNIEYNNKKFEDIELRSDRLNVVFTQHPDGLVGEIMGKASNEDWGGRQASLFIKSKGIDPEVTLVTSLDADSKLSSSYFSFLAYRYCLHPNRFHVGFEPIPAYTNNYFECTILPRLISTQTTLWQLSQNNLNRETVFFANYSVPMKVLQEVDFWEREFIAEDYLFFAKCVTHYKGDFHVISFNGVFKGDTVVGEDYLESLENQYKQLQRWTWGGVESFPYVFKKFFLTEEGKKVRFLVKFKILSDVFLNHFFWATTPVIFSVGVALPGFFGGAEFGQTQTAHNLSTFAQYFAWTSITFIIIYSFITYQFVVKRSLNKKHLTIVQTGKLFLQAMISPIIYGLMGIPAIHSQYRGVVGKYLGYWVTPKK